MSKQDWGAGTVYLRGRIWWASYPVPGQKQVNESTKETDEKKARQFLRRRVQEVTTRGVSSVRADKVVIGELLDDLLKDYEANGKSIAWAKIVVNHLRPVLGMQRACTFGTDAYNKYVDSRRVKGIQNSTINRELAILRRAFKLGALHEPPKVIRLPRIVEFDENNIRKGFFESADFERLKTFLPAELVPVVEFAYSTGCRKGEIMKLQWSQFDAAEGLVRLNPGETKNDDSRVIPLTDELLEMLTRMKAERDANWAWSRYIFTRDGQRIRSFKAAWAAACTKAGIPGALFHDFRRTGVRNLVRAGVSEKIVMRISGHRTRDVFERYNIVDERDLKEAAKKLSEHQKKGKA